jgi:HlyD family secretion protein
MAKRPEPDIGALRPAIADEELADRRRKRLVRRRRVRWIKRIAIVLVALAAAGALVRALMPGAVPVDLGEVRRGELRVFLEEDGKTRVRERYVVSAPVSGDLVRVAVEAGDPVAEGQEVARIVQPPAQLLDPRSRAETEARLRAAEASERQAGAAVARASASASLADREAARLSALAARGVVPRVDSDRAVTQADVSRHELAAARLAARVAAADVQMVRAALGQVRQHEPSTVAIPAPAGGRVLKIDRESGGPIVAGAAILEVGDPRSVEAVIDVLSSEAVKVAVGAPVWIDEWGGGRPLVGRVRAVEPSAFTHVSALGIEEQRVNVIVEFTGTPPQLGDGFRVEARILLWDAKAVTTVPASALFRSGGGWAVYAVEDGRARLRPVTIGMRGRSEVEVLGGVTPGTRVVLYPGDRVVDGARVASR